MIQHFDKQLKGVLWPIDQYFERNLGLIQPPISVINWRRWTQKVVRRWPNSTTPWSPHVVFKKQEDLCGGIINPVRLTRGNTLPSTALWPPLKDPGNTSAMDEVGFITHCDEGEHTWRGQRGGT